MARIRIIKENEATGELAELYELMRRNNPRGVVPDIMKTMSQRPDVMRLMSEVAARLHFSAGALTRAHHEMIAAYVSAVTRCHY